MTDRSHHAMRICHVLLSPTFGMHQYTAELANGMASTSHRARLVTTVCCARDRYAPPVEIHTPFTSAGTGFPAEGTRLRAALLDLGVGISALVVHFADVHLWNLPLVWAPRPHGVPVVHTLHDVNPHQGRRFAGLIRLWNPLLIASRCHLLVHGRRHRLLAQGVAPHRVTYARCSTSSWATKHLPRPKRWRVRCATSPRPSSAGGCCPTKAPAISSRRRLKGRTIRGTEGQMHS
jgi:hypothetical protein